MTPERNAHEAHLTAASVAAALRPVIPPEVADEAFWIIFDVLRRGPVGAERHGAPAQSQVPGGRPVRIPPHRGEGTP